MTASRVLVNSSRNILVNSNRAVAQGIPVVGGVGGALSGYCLGGTSTPVVVGDVDGSPPGRVQVITQWMGKQAGCHLHNTGANPAGATWTSVRSTDVFSNNLCARLDDMGIMSVINFPIVPRTLVGNFAECANGDYDSQMNPLIQDIFNQVGANGKVAFRVGHEANHNKSFPYACDFDRVNADGIPYKNYKAAFNHVAELILTKIPTAFIEWSMFKTCQYVTGTSPNQVTNYYSPDLIYPGGTFITHIGSDWYDNGPSATASNYTAVKNDVQGSFPSGIQSWCNYARAKGKRFAVSEWGSRPNFIGTTNTGGGGDNPEFVKTMAQIFAEPTIADLLDWHAYFRIDEACSATDDSAHALFYFTSGTPSVANMNFNTPFFGHKGGTGNGLQVGSTDSRATGDMTPWYRHLFGTGPLPT